MITVPPPRENMRYHALVTWLMQNGYSVFEIRRLVDKEVIKPNYIPFSRNAYYSATQVKEVLDGNRSKGGISNT